MERLLAYWRDRLAGVAPLALPADRPRPAFWDGSGDVVRFELPAELVAAVDGVARAHRATRYMVLLAAYQALLGRHSGRTDIAVCTTLADRGRADVARLIGPFVNTIVLRTDLGGGPTFAELLERVRAGALRDFSHAEAPFDRVVGAVAGERDLSRHPLAQASFTLLNTAPAPARLAGLDVETVRTPLAGTPLDVFLDLSLRADGAVAARLQFSTALFDRDSMVRFADGYTALLRAVTDAPGRPLTELTAGLEPLPGRERRRLLEAAGRADGAAAAAGSGPFAVSGPAGAPALVCGDETLTYGGLDVLSGRIAAVLAGAGVRPGSPVGVFLRRGVRSVAAMAAVWRAGGVYVPMDPALPAERLRFMAAEAGVVCLLADAETGERAAGLGPRVLAVEDAEHGVGSRRDGGSEHGGDPAVAAPRHVPGPRELAYVVFTSGSTGRPKAVGVEHGAMAAHAAAARAEFGITAGDRVLAFSSFSFDASLDQLLTALGCGACLVVRPDEQWLPARVPALVERYGITVLNLPPTYWAEVAFALTDRSAAALAGLRLLVLGGEAVPAGALAAWLARAPHVRVVNAYGPTETVVTAAAHDVDPGADPALVPIGRPLGGRRVYVVDGRDELVGDGVPGELLIGGPELARGYLGQPALTAERFTPDPYGAPGGRLYRTGDLVRRLPSGELEFTGRTDDQVKIRGFRVELGEVEAVLARCPGVAAAAAAVGADAQGGASLTGYVVPAPGAGPETVAPAALRAFCAERLPQHAVPAAFAVLDALPVGPAGKLDRAALPAAGPGRDGRAAAATAYAAPRNEAEQAVADIWAEVLGVERVGIDDGFFDLGGHSLLATMAVSRIAERLGREVELRTLFENPRIREFGPVVAAARQAGAASVAPVDRSGPLPLSFAQERMWFLDRMSGAGDEYVLWYSWRIRGGLDRAAWQAALDDVASRHEALRTALVEVDGRPAQLVRPAAGVPPQQRHARRVRHAPLRPGRTAAAARRGVGAGPARPRRGGRLPPRRDRRLVQGRRHRRAVRRVRGPPGRAGARTAAGAGAVRGLRGLAARADGRRGVGAAARLLGAGPGGPARAGAAHGPAPPGGLVGPGRGGGGRPAAGAGGRGRGAGAAARREPVHGAAGGAADRAGPLVRAAGRGRRHARRRPRTGGVGAARGTAGEHGGAAGRPVRRAVVRGVPRAGPRGGAGRLRAPGSAVRAAGRAAPPGAGPLPEPAFPGDVRRPGERRGRASRRRPGGGALPAAVAVGQVRPDGHLPALPRPLRPQRGVRERPVRRRHRDPVRRPRPPRPGVGARRPGPPGLPAGPPRPAGARPAHRPRARARHGAGRPAVHGGRRAVGGRAGVRRAVPDVRRARRPDRRPGRGTRRGRSGPGGARRGVHAPRDGLGGGDGGRVAGRRRLRTAGPGPARGPAPVHGRTGRGALRRHRRRDRRPGGRPRRAADPRGRRPARPGRTPAPARAAGARLRVLHVRVHRAAQGGRRRARRTRRARPHRPRAVRDHLRGPGAELRVVLVRRLTGAGPAGADRRSGGRGPARRGVVGGGTGRPGPRRGRHRDGADPLLLGGGRGAPRHRRRGPEGAAAGRHRRRGPAVGAAGPLVLVPAGRTGPQHVRADRDRRLGDLPAGHRPGGGPRPHRGAVGRAPGVRRRRVRGAGPGRRTGRTADRRAGTGTRLPRPAGPDRRAVHPRPVRRPRQPALPHRRPGPPTPLRGTGLPRPDRRPGQDPRLPHRARRGPGRAGGAPGRPRGGR
ncbi:amino acid adenylation domain-containing protein, partial [Streptomyces sp. WAC05292]